MNRIVYLKKNYNFFLKEYFNNLSNLNTKCTDGFAFNLIGNQGSTQVEKFLDKEQIEFLHIIYCDSLDSGDIQYIHSKYPQFKYLK